MKRRILIRQLKTIGRKRKFKRLSDRKLSIRDLAVLDFLWTWKVATTPILGEVGYKGKSVWWVYKALRQLQRERYIQLLPRGKNLEQELWALTDLGFEVILMDRDDLIHYRYKPHAPAHDYLGTCLQLGDLWQFNVEKMFYTEQMLASLAPSNFPKHFKEPEGHVPDGITVLRHQLKDAVIGYEVDLNLKDLERYKMTFEYYREVKPRVIFWLVRNTWMAERILSIANRDYYYFQNGEEIYPPVCFILVEDFKEKLWEAEIINGKYKGETIRKLHAKLLQNMGKETANFGQKSLKEIFFPKYKSPQKSITYGKKTDAEFY